MCRGAKMPKSDRDRNPNGRRRVSGSGREATRARPAGIALTLLALTSCTTLENGAPICLFNCHVGVSEITDNPALATVTTQGGAVTKTSTKTETNTEGL